MNLKSSLVPGLRLVGLAVVGALLATPVEAQRFEGRDGDGSQAQREFERQMDNAKEVSDRQEKARIEREMRDKTLDGRIGIGRDTSVGGRGTNGPGRGGEINIRKDFDGSRSGG